MYSTVIFTNKPNKDGLNEEEQRKFKPYKVIGLDEEELLTQGKFKLYVMKQKKFFDEKGVRYTQLKDYYDMDPRDAYNEKARYAGVFIFRFFTKSGEDDVNSVSWKGEQNLYFLEPEDVSKLELEPVEIPFLLWDNEDYGSDDLEQYRYEEEEY